MRSALALAAICACLLGSAWAQPKPLPEKPAQQGAHGDLLGAPNDADTALRAHDLGGSCFVVEREPGDAGGLRIPQQVVCPTFAPPEVGSAEAPPNPALSPAPKR